MNPTNKIFWKKFEVYRDGKFVGHVDSPNERQAGYWACEKFGRWNGTRVINYTVKEVIYELSPL